MLEQKVYSGYWWLPDFPDNKVSGEATIDDEQHVNLSIMGSLVERDSCHQVTKKIEAITGITKEGKYVTLLDCFDNGFQINVPGIQQQHYRVRVLAVGVMLETSQNLLLKSLSFRCTYLDEWVGRDSFTTQTNRDLAEIDIKYCKPNTVEVNLVGDYKLKIDSNLKLPSLQKNKKEIQITEQDWMTIEPIEEKNIDDLWRVVNHLCNFLSLVIGQPVYITQINAKSELAKGNNRGDQYYKNIQVFLSGLDQSKNNISLKHPRNMLLSLSSIEGKLESILEAWFRCREVIKPTLDLYFYTFYESTIHLQRDFLFLAQAVETYHRRTSEETDLTEDEHEVRLQKILDSVPAEYKSWLEGKLKYSNELNLRKRIKDLIDRFSDVLGNYIHRKNFTNKVLNTRNYLTHYDPELENTSAKGTANFLDLIYKLRTILEVCFLSELQLSNEKIATVMEEKIQERQQIVERNRK